MPFGADDRSAGGSLAALLLKQVASLGRDLRGSNRDWPVRALKQVSQNQHP